jgi:tetratricopeptide (TPR) repeat protein
MPTIAETLTAAVKLHREGDLARAGQLYHEILSVDARNAAAWHLLGLVQHAKGESAAAIESIGRAIQLDGAQAAFHNNLAEVYRSLGNSAAAIRAYRAALGLNPRLTQAEKNLGALLQSQSQLAEAIACYRRALAIEPHDANTLCNLGSALSEQDHADQAMECFRRALEYDAELAEAHFNSGTILQKQGHLAAAAACYQSAIRGKPDCVGAHINLGTIYKSQYRLNEAIECYQRALEFQPDFAEALNNLGNVFKLQGRITEAAICYERTLQIKPDDLQARYNRGLVRLAMGNLADGWPDYECRYELPEVAKRSFTKPRWQGEELDGRVLLVHAEQGMGDTLQFIRYVPLLAREGGKIVVEVAEALVPLLARSDLGASVRLVGQGTTLPDFDCHVPLLSLPGIFGTTLENIPDRVPYLSADPALVEHWRGKLEAGGRRPQAGGRKNSLPSSAGLRPAASSQFKVGIAWQGSTTYRADRLRSIAVARFAPLAQDGVELVSLQKEPGSEQLAEIADSFRVRDLGEAFDREHGAFMDTAAVMQCLDLVVTSDTSIAHLAGGLGVAVWVALPLSPDWRWLVEREDSPWYPTMRLFRQTSFDDWSPVFERMATELRRRIAACDLS